MAAISLTITVCNGDGEGSDDDEDAADGEEEPEIAAEFSECINICQTARFKSFQDSNVNRTIPFQFHSPHNFMA